MSQASGQQVEFTVTEHFERNTVMWTARAGREQIAQVTQRLFGSMCDSGELIDAIAEHYRVERDAVTFDNKRRRRNQPFRYVPKRGWVQLPAKPGTCGHKAGDDACELPTCEGAPKFPVKLDRNVETATVEQTPSESGVVTVVRDLTGMVERMTGLRTSGLRFADNGWSDMRPGARKLQGWEFQVDDEHGPMQVQVLVYESKHPLDTYARRHGAVYVGAARIVGDLDMEGPHTKWLPEIARHLVPIVQDMHDAVELANARPENGWSLKSVPPGHLIEHATGLAVVKESRVGGGTLLVHDLIGREHYADRAQDGWWVVFPAARDAHGDTFARFEQRQAWRSRLVAHRHQAQAHTGRPGDCLDCIGEVIGPQNDAGHHLGKYSPAPWCWFCGSRPETPDASQACPGLPKRLPADYDRAQLERAAAGGEQDAGAIGPADAVYEVGDRVRVRVNGREASGRVAVVEQVGDDRVYEVIRAGLASTCVGAWQMRPDPTPAPEVGQTWVCDAIGATVTVQAVHEDGLTAETAERGAVILAAPNWRPGTLPVSDDLAQRAQAFAASVDRTNGELDAAIEAHNANPTPETHERVMAAARQHTASFQADERAELMAKQYGPRPAAAPEPEPDAEPAPDYGVFVDGVLVAAARHVDLTAEPTPVEPEQVQPDPWGDVLDLLGV